MGDVTTGFVDCVHGQFTYDASPEITAALTIEGRKTAVRKSISIED
jgi:hypothetical protein